MKPRAAFATQPAVLACLTLALASADAEILTFFDVLQGSSVTTAAISDTLTSQG